MNFKTGKLYQIKKYYWMLFPTKETASSSAVASTAYLSKQFNCNVTYISPNDIFCLLEQDGNFMKVLTINGEIGWMIYPKDLIFTNGYIEEVIE